jgi:hypothetical protein
VGRERCGGEQLQQITAVQGRGQRSSPRQKGLESYA